MEDFTGEVRENALRFLPQEYYSNPESYSRGDLYPSDAMYAMWVDNM
jgi:hypothetical protein